MKHGSQLDTEFAGTVHRHPQLKFFTDYPRLPCLSQSTPKGGVQQNNIHGVGSDTGCQLLKIDDYRIGCGGYTDLLPDPPHPFQSPGRVFEIVIGQILNSPSNPNSFFNTPGGVWINPEGMPWKSPSQLPEYFQLMVRMKNTGLQFMGRKPMFINEILCMIHHLVRRFFSPHTGTLVRIPKKQVGCKRNAFPYCPSQQITCSYS